MKRFFSTLRVVSALSLSEKTPLTAKQLSVATDMSVPWIETVMVPLRHHGLIRSLKGPGGGYCLSRSDITAGDVFRLFSGQSVSWLTPVCTALDTVALIDMADNKSARSERHQSLKTVSAPSDLL